MRRTLQRALFYCCTVLALAGFLVLTGCKDEPEIIPEKSDEKNIISFTVGDVAGVIETDMISVTVPVRTNISSLEPVITVSGGATVFPASGTAIDFTNPVTYTIRAENGSTKIYTVTISTGLESIAVISPPYKTEYSIGTELDLTGLIVRCYYFNGSEENETVTEADLSNYDNTKPGTQYVVVTLGGKTSTFTVTVTETAPTGQLALTLGLVTNEDNSIAIYGLPDGDIKLSTGSQNGLPNSILISTGGAHPSAIYDSITWFIDGVQCFNGDNIITIYATHYTFIMPHTITIIVVKDGVAYSRTLIFTVEA
jgi:hypothetical protein